MWGFGSKLFRGVVDLLFRPGFPAKESLAGRRASPTLSHGGAARLRRLAGGTFWRSVPAAWLYPMTLGTGSLVLTALVILVALSHCGPTRGFFRNLPARARFPLL